MKANKVGATKSAQVGTATAVGSIKEKAIWNAGELINDRAGSKGVDYLLNISLSLLLKQCIAKPALFKGLVRLGFRTVIHRNPGAKGALKHPRIGLRAFINAIEAADFRGDERPNKDDVREGKRFFASMTGGEFTPEAAIAFVKKNYGWELDPTEDGFAIHEMRKRLKVEEELAKKKAALGRL